MGFHGAGVTSAHTMIVSQGMKAFKLCVAQTKRAERSPSSSVMIDGDACLMALERADVAGVALALLIRLQLTRDPFVVVSGDAKGPCT